MAKIKFNGEEYELVDFNTITLDEALILREYSDLNIDEVQDAGFHAGVIGALIHISVTRANPAIPKKQLRQQVGKMPMAELEQVFEDIAVDDDADEGDDASPPAVLGPSDGPTGPGEQPTTNEPAESSGDNGEPSSESPAIALRAIGSPG